MYYPPRTGDAACTHIYIPHYGGYFSTSIFNPLKLRYVKLYMHSRHVDGWCDGSQAREHRVAAAAVLWHVAACNCLYPVLKSAFLILFEPPVQRWKE